MKVLFITGEFPPMQGGMGDYTRQLGLALADLGCQVHVITSDQAGPVDRLTVYPVVRRWKWGCWRPILRIIREIQPQVIHIQYQAAAYGLHPAINFLPWRVRRLGKYRPHPVVTFHDLRVPYLFPKAGPVRRWVVNQLARESDAAITTNREDFENLGRDLSPSAPVLIPIGSNIQPRPPADYDREAWRARWGAGPEDFLLCFFGFINERKGVDTLLHAMHRLVTDPSCPVHPRLLFIGGQTGTSDPTNIAFLGRVQALISELGLEPYVCWTGYIPEEEVSASFWASDLCVLPFRDGVSFLHGTLHAALAHGMPILTTRPRVHLPELVPGENIFLVPPDQPHALAEAILHLAGAPELRSRLGVGARALSQQFRWDRIAADTLTLYRTLSRRG